MTDNNGVIEIRPLTDEEMTQAYILEKEGFPEDEADSFDILMYRHREAPELTVGFFCNGDLLATVCVHTLCVSSKNRRQGIASKLLKHFTDTIRQNQTDVVRILLMTKSYLIPFYTRAGFVFRAESAFEHGKDQWYEFEMIM